MNRRAFLTLFPGLAGVALLPWPESFAEQVARMYDVPLRMIGPSLGSIHEAESLRYLRVIAETVAAMPLHVWKRDSSGRYHHETLTP